MPFLTDEARKAFSRKRAYVPEWMQLAQWVALGLLGATVAVFYFLDGGMSDQPVAQLPGTGTVQPVQTRPASPAPTPSGSTATGTSSVPDTDGRTVNVPTAALAAAKAAALAVWTGNWTGVPLNGSAPKVDDPRPGAKVGAPKVYTSTSTVVVFLFPLDIDGDGRNDQSFQLSVIKDGDRWVFPTGSG